MALRDRGAGTRALLHHRLGGVSKTALARGLPDTAYLIMMAVRLLEMRRVLKDSGSIYQHCDFDGERTTSSR